MKLTRRTFLKSSAITGAGLTILPSGLLAAGNSPNEKLNIALIGVWGKGKSHHKAIKGENVVALCDINDKNMALAAETFPKARRYRDWRKCLEQKDIDAVLCATTDHTHAFISTWAMNRGLHVYCEKPLANSVEEARMVRNTYLKNKDKIATQVGTQRHAYENFNRLRELVHDGAIGELKSAYAWGCRQLPKPGYLPALGEPPEHIHYDLWIGPAQFHPYNPGYFKGKAPGSNCLSWNMYWDFGTGQVGDMGSHTMDIVWNVVDAGIPASAEARGEPVNPEVSPVELEMHFEHPANDWRDPITVSWYQGGAMPKSPKDYINLKEIKHGAMFKGSAGFVVADFMSRIILPYGNGANMTYYKPRAKEDLIPKSGNHQAQWINACKGNLKTSCNFDYAGKMIEQMMLGLVAYRTGKKIEWDKDNMKAANCPEADQYIRKTYRKGWALSG
ncbi:Gfo/Idh/MocA family protein [Verrucomicrobiota bacterium]